MTSDPNIRFRDWAIIAAACLLATLVIGADVPALWSALQ